MIYKNEEQHFFIFLFSGIILSIIAGATVDYWNPPEIEAKPIEGKRGMLEATYYSPSLIGQEMANQQPYDALAMTCATSTMFPLGSFLKVTNMENARSIIVEVTDRHDGLTDLDLSFQAYTTLRDYDGVMDSGKIPVIISKVNNDK